MLQFYESHYQTAYIQHTKLQHVQAMQQGGKQLDHHWWCYFLPTDDGRVTLTEDIILYLYFYLVFILLF